MTNFATVKLSNVEWIVITRALDEYKKAQGLKMSDLEAVIIDQTITHMAAVEKQFTR